MSAGVLIGRGHRGDSGRGLFEQGIDRRVDGHRVQKRLVSLHIYKDVALFVGRDFGHALCAGAMVGTRHAGGAAEAFHGLHDAFIVCCDNHAVGLL